MSEGKSASLRMRRTLHPLAWHEIDEPGAYVEVSTGNLYRISQESLVKVAAPVASESGAGAPASPLVKLSNDPFIVALAARMLCVEHDIRPNF